jgi:hypothetical protein
MIVVIDPAATAMMGATARMAGKARPGLLDPQALPAPYSLISIVYNQMSLKVDKFAQPR